MRAKLPFNLLLFGTMMSPGAVISAPQSADFVEFFETRIRPVLANHCYSCHTDSQMGGLRVDSKESLLKGGKSGPAILPEMPEQSLLIQAVSHSNERLKMPLGGNKLKDSEIADLTTWVKGGAVWPNSANQPASVSKSPEFVIKPEQRAFWSFQPIKKPELPQVKEKSWCKTPIDRFVLAKLEAKGLKPVAAADKRTLIRRASFDLIGLPPTPEEVDAFLKDSSSEAFSKVVDHLLASPHYGERWGRYWLDVARYGEDDSRGLSVETYPNAFRYRDWVIQALNADMPYDLFVKAQIAGDLLKVKNQKELLPGLGFFGLGPWFYDTTVPLQARADERHDRVDVLTRGFLGLTVACARCHDHKFDPISTRDYYALAGVFSSSQYQEYPLASEDAVDAYNEHQKGVKDQEAALKDFIQKESMQLGEILARKSSRYMLAAWKVLQKAPETRLSPASSSVMKYASNPASTADPAVAGTAGKNNASPSPSSTAPPSFTNPRIKLVAEQENLDSEILERWVKYLGTPQKDHPFLKPWYAALKNGASEESFKKMADEFQTLVLSVIEEKKTIDEGNHLILEKSKPPKNAAMTSLPNGFSTYEEFCPGCNVSVESLERDKYVLWSDLFSTKIDGNDPTKKEGRVLLFHDDQLERFLGPEWKSHLGSMRTELETLKKSMPSGYPYLHGIGESTHPANLKLHLRGSPFNLGDEVSRRFLPILSEGEPLPLQKGSGRLELAEAIVQHPLTARVMVNRIWKHHFGQGLVETPSNFGQLGERPTHPELLEFLAGRFMENRWSMKSLHREIILSATYQLSSEDSEKNFAVDPDNRFYWHANRHRLDAEALRDSLLFVSRSLDPALGGPSSDLTAENRRRTVYAKVSRFKLDGTLALFDFPNPGITSEKRNVTNVPLQRLFFLNSDMVALQAQRLVERLNDVATDTDAAKIKKAYQLLFSRALVETELQLGLEFLGKAQPGTGSASAWQQYAQVLLSSNEFSFVD